MALNARYSIVNYNKVKLQVSMAQIKKKEERGGGRERSCDTKIIAQ